ncbi:phage tail sheath family protein [Algoriphagus vanfongensis]|uniref:phage tail sheath family protein n=1 Tax=Algoriphagus vanfongensis TaxID=426371 RepID=UPI00040BC7FF|nr:phage tail sheath C-terminal domain-containing protein [Algoriphagus vanfongensis]
MANYSTPGVYIEEISTLPASIAAVETAIPAFIGHTDLATKNGELLRGVPTRITSMLEYESIFGTANTESIAVSISDTYTGSDGQPATLASRTISVTPPTQSAYKMYYALRLFFDNGGGPCYIISVNDFTAPPTVGASTTINTLLWGLAAVEKVDEPTMLLFPDDLTMANAKTVYEAALAQCAKLQDRFTVMDVKENTTDPFADAGNFRNNGIGSGNLKYGAAYYPDLKTAIPLGYASSSVTISQSDNYIGTGTPAPAIVNAANGSNLDALETADPSLFRSLTAELAKLYAKASPSGAVAGVYARVDSQRGVWKAPANVDIRSIIGPAVKVTHEQQASLNIDASSGKSINAIRSFTGKGTLIWGARTLAGNDNEWRYVPVRRLFIFVEESVKKATEFVVFEPNDANTWLRVKTMIENFLSKLWRDGALAGAKPEQAFFVKVGLGVTMTAQDILEGRMNVEIGMAAVRPAEFIILKFSHKLQES